MTPRSPRSASCRLARLRTLALAVVATVAVPLSGGAAAQDSEALEPAQEALRSGEYADAIERFEAATADGVDAVEARRGLARALRLVGRYEEAERTLRDGIDSGDGGDLWNPLGELLRETGRIDEAERAFRRAIREESRDALDARLNLALLEHRRGRMDEAMAAFDEFIDVYNRTRALSARELTAVATAVRHLGRTNPDLFQDALRAYDEAVEADPSLLEPRILTGELFLDKYNSQDARQTFQEILSINPNHPAALVGLARALDFDNEGGAADTARKALETNPNYAPAHVFLARVSLQLERYDQAEESARAALEANPAFPEGLAVLAATHHLRDDTAAFRRVRERADSLYPESAQLPLTVAEISVTHRRYDEAVQFSREATERDPQNWQAVGTLGLNQLRTGEVEEGRRNLERAFEGDPYNVWFKNTLDLLDTWAEYETRSTEHFEIVIHRDEADLLGPYVERLAEAAYADLIERYEHEPPTPIRLEVYPSHADFSVRTVGLTGLGALGVSFGEVVVLDSPTARDPASFNWASALWHEIAHSVHMSISRHRVPRWFSEGLAVEDQRRGEEGWGHGANVAFLQAFDAGRLPPASRLNDGFMRPEFPGQVVLSYFQASLLFEFLEETAGFDAVRQLLRGYADGATTQELLPEVLGWSSEELDERFDAYVRQRFEGSLDAVRGAPPPERGDADRESLEQRVSERPDDFPARLRLGSMLRREGDLETAAEHLTAALRLFPEYAGNDGPHWELARIREAQGRPQEAIEHLGALRTVNESHLPGALLEAEILEREDELEAAARALERAIQIAPFEIEVHERLAEIYTGLDRHEAAVAEREAVVALNPVDMAQAWYRVAEARLAAEDRSGAREAVLRALERAPRFDEALELLLEIRGDSADASPDAGNDGDAPPPR